MILDIHKINNYLKEKRNRNVIFKDDGSENGSWDPDVRTRIQLDPRILELAFLIKMNKNCNYKILLIV